MKSLISELGLVLLAGTAKADSLWAYQGNTMDGCKCALTGTVDLSAGDSVVSWSFTDGAHTISSANGTGSINPFERGNAAAPFDFESTENGRPVSYTFKLRR
jgi:hypothetical protein